MASKEEKRDETPTKLVHVNGATVTVPAYKVEERVASGLFNKPTKK